MFNKLKKSSEAKINGFIGLSFLFYLLPLLTSSASASASTSSQTQTMTADQSTIFVGPENPDFNIVIKANPSTGYQWLLRNYNADLLTPVKSTFEDDPKLPKEQKLGASVNQIWEFKIDDQAFAVPTITQIGFVQLRPWDTNTSLSQKDDLVVKIIIDPGYKSKTGTGNTDQKPEQK